jgi:hypothetical protein
MDATTCEICGCLIGDQETHRSWHARAEGDPSVVADAEPNPDAQQGPDAAPYSA